MSHAWWFTQVYDQVTLKRSTIESYSQETGALRSTQPFSITLPNEMAAAMKAKVARGEYATESEVIREGLHALLERDQAIETWLREQVVPAAIELQRDPSRGLTPAQVREHLARKRQAHAHAGKP